MKHIVTLIPGDGIGPEVTKPAQEIIKAAGVEIEWESFLAGAEAWRARENRVGRAAGAIRKTKWL